jgi:hypothetical protein
VTQVTNLGQEAVQELVIRVLPFLKEEVKLEIRFREQVFIWTLRKGTLGDQL